MKKFYDEENDINFIVSGALNKRTYHHSGKEKEVRKISNTDLTENDFFVMSIHLKKKKVLNQILKQLPVWN